MCPCSMYVNSNRTSIGTTIRPKCILYGYLGSGFRVWGRAQGADFCFVGVWGVTGTAEAKVWISMLMPRGSWHVEKKLSLLRGVDPASWFSDGLGFRVSVPAYHVVPKPQTLNPNPKPL